MPQLRHSQDSSLNAKNIREKKILKNEKKLKIPKNKMSKE